MALAIETLQQIFVYVAWDSLTPHNCVPHNPAVAQVCIKWHEAAKKVPDLWNRIDLAHPKFLQHVLLHYKFDIYVAWRCGSEKNMGPLQLALPQDVQPKLSRIRGIDFWGYDDNVNRLFAALPSNMPVLKTINVWSMTRATVADWFAHLNAPQLEELTMEGVSIDWTATVPRVGSRLVKLIIEGDFTFNPRPPMLSDVLSVLENLKELRYLTLTDATFSCGRSNVDQKDVVMPSLRRLEVFGTVRCCAALLRHVRPAVPDGFHLRVRCDPHRYAMRPSRSTAINALWASVSRCVTSLDGPSDITIEIGPDVTGFLRRDVATNAFLDVHLPTQFRDIPAFLDMPLVNRPIEFFNIVYRLPAEEPDRDPDYVPIRRSPKVEGCVRAIASAISIYELRLTGDHAVNALKQLIKESQTPSHLLQPNGLLPESLRGLRSLDFEDLRSDASLQMSRKALSDLSERSECLRYVTYSGCAAIEDTGAYIDGLRKEMPRLSISSLDFYA